MPSCQKIESTDGGRKKNISVLHFISSSFSCPVELIWVRKCINSSEIKRLATISRQKIQSANREKGKSCIPLPLSLPPSLPCLAVVFSWHDLSNDYTVVGIKLEGIKELVLRLLEPRQNQFINWEKIMCVAFHFLAFVFGWNNQTNEWTDKLKRSKKHVSRDSSLKNTPPRGGIDVKAHKYNPELRWGERTN